MAMGAFHLGTSWHKHRSIFLNIQ